MRNIESAILYLALLVGLYQTQFVDSCKSMSQKEENKNSKFLTLIQLTVEQKHPNQENLSLQII